MESTSMRDTAIAKLLELSPEEVSKVLIFMAGLDAGAKLNPDTYCKNDGNGTGRKEKINTKLG